MVGRYLATASFVSVEEGKCKALGDNMGCIPIVVRLFSGTEVAQPFHLVRQRLTGFAEDGGFEPPRALTQHAFQACAIGH